MTTTTIINYTTPTNKKPFADWLNSLDTKSASIILARLARVEVGLFGDCEPVGNGVSELKFDYGPGYRVYFGKLGRTVVILLTGGDKRSQARDIAKAKRYWVDYKGSVK